MPVIVTLPDRSSQVLAGSSIPIGGILHRLGINPVEVIVTRNGKIVPDDAVAGDGDRIRILPIAHGG